MGRLIEVFRIDYHNGWLVGFYLLLVGGFVYGLLRPRTTAQWRSLGLAQAFVVALYAEMYGLPLTLYGLAWLTGRADWTQDHFHGHAWAYLFNWGETGAIVLTVIGNLLIVMGAALAVLGWRQVHSARGQLVQTGLYRHIRHPQYTGFFLFLLGSLVNWPTLPTLLMLPALLWTYGRLAGLEERDVQREFGADYEAYRKRTGRFIPRLGRTSG